MRTSIARFMKPHIVFYAFAFCMAPALQISLFADDLELTTGVHVQGKVSEVGDKYKVMTYDGAELLYEKKQVRSVLKWTKETQDALKEYKSRLAQMEDTVEGHYKMIDWAESKQLRAIAQSHRERIIELDPNDTRARAALKYIKTDQNVWVLSEKFNRQRGKVLNSEKKWRFPEQVADADEEARIKAETRRIDKLLELVSSPNPKKSAEAVAYLKSLKDPLAVGKLRQMILGDKNHTAKDLPRDMQLMMIEGLGRIQTPTSLMLLCDIAIHHNDHHLQESAIEQIKVLGVSPAVDYILSVIHRFASDREQGARDRKQAVINSAGRVLGELGDKSAIYEMIGMLEMTFQEVLPAGPSTNIGFDSTGNNTGIGQNNSPKMISGTLQNSGILQGLQTLSGVDYQYDQSRWIDWYSKFAGTKTDLDLWRDP